MKLNANLMRVVLLACIGFSQLVGQLSFAIADLNSNVGGVTGGGGDAIVCNDGNYYSYDYVVTEGVRDPINADYYISDGASAEKKTLEAVEILSMIADKLKAKNSILGASLEDFIRSLDENNIFEPNANRIWIIGNNPLKPVTGASNIRIPARCVDKSGKPRVYQAVVRFSLKEITQYYADGNVLTALNQTSPLQLSFLYLHEWLRDFIDDATIIAQVDRFFHGTSWLKASPAGLLEALRKYGVDIKRINRVRLSLPQDPT
jgi:hypothetical protein